MRIRHITRTVDDFGIFYRFKVEVADGDETVGIVTVDAGTLLSLARFRRAVLENLGLLFEWTPPKALGVRKGWEGEIAAGLAAAEKPKHAWPPAWATQTAARN